MEKCVEIGRGRKKLRIFQRSFGNTVIFCFLFPAGSSARPFEECAFVSLSEVWTAPWSAERLCTQWSVPAHRRRLRPHWFQERSSAKPAFRSAEKTLPAQRWRYSWWLSRFSLIALPVSSPAVPGIA